MGGMVLRQPQDIYSQCREGSKGLKGLPEFPTSACWELSVKKDVWLLPNLTLQAAARPWLAHPPQHTAKPPPSAPTLCAPNVTQKQIISAEQMPISKTACQISLLVSSNK